MVLIMICFAPGYATSPLAPDDVLTIGGFTWTQQIVTSRQQCGATVSHPLWLTAKG
jgi:hypothetical protein